MPSGRMIAPSTRITSASGLTVTPWRVTVSPLTETRPDSMILSQARRITQSDGGSLYLVEGRDTPQPKLRFKLTESDTLSLATAGLLFAAKLADFRI